MAFCYLGLAFDLHLGDVIFFRSAKLIHENLPHTGDRQSIVLTSDENSFTSKGQPIGENTQELVKGQIDKQFTLTLLTTLSGPLPVVIYLPAISNTTDVFLEYVLWIVEGNHILDGDYLIIDNAPVHTAEETLETLVDLLEGCNIKLVFLPTFSPELNPCELCFSYIKRFVGENLSNESLIN